MMQQTTKPKAANLRALREAAHMRQQDLADIIGVHNSLISLYESGQRVPSMGAAIRMARVFGVTLDDLMTGPEDHAA